MARTVEAILKANVSGFNSSVDSAAAKIGQLGTKAVAAGAKVDAGLAAGAKSAGKLGTTTSRAGVVAAAGLDKAAVASTRFGRSGDGIRKNADHLNTLSRTAGLAGAAIVGGIGLAVKATADFDQAMSHVSATGQDYTQNLGALRTAAIEAGAATSFSATEAANAQEELAKAGVSAADALGGGLTGALDLAAAGSLGVADAANIAATAMTQFGLTGADVPHIADLLAAGAGKAQGSVQDLGNALNYVGPVAKSMGVSIEETVGALAQFASAGIVGEQGGTALRGVLLSLVSPSKLAADTMKQYGISLYDAQGAFVGVNGAAQELADGLGGLGEAERNAALGRIFGNAQITAATVLYKNGAAGVDNWTAKVNDSGFAARTAATKMDNLRGDVEKLGGSLQNALIQSGEGATGGLRGLVKAADSAVGAFNNLSPSTKSAGLAIAAIGGAGLLSVAGIAKLAVGAAEARAAMSALKTDSPRLAGALGGIGKAAGVAAGALIALQVAGMAAKAFHGVLVPDIKAADAALKSLAATGNSVNLDKMFNIQTKSFGQTITEVDSLGSAFQALGRENWADRLNGQIDSMLGTTETSFTRLRVQFDGLDQSLIGLTSSGHADQAAAAFKKIADQAALQGYPVEKLIQLFPQYADSVKAAATASGVANLAGQELADAMGGQLSPALEKALVSAGKLPAGMNTAANATLLVGTALESLKNPTKLTAEQTQQLSGQLFASGNAFQTAAGTHAAYASSLDVADKALGRNSLSINKQTGFLADNTQKQRDAGAALNDIATSGKAYVQALVAQGGSARDAAKATADVRAEFVAAADAAGLSSKQASKLADSYGLIPDEVSTTFQAFGLALQEQQVKDYGDRILALPKEQQSIIMATYRDKDAKAAEAQLKQFEKMNVVAKMDVDTAGARAKVDAVTTAIKTLPKTTATKIEAIYNNQGADAAFKALKLVDGKTGKFKIDADSKAALAKITDVNSKKLPDKKVKVGADSKGAEAGIKRINRGMSDLDGLNVKPSITPPSGAAKKRADDTSSSLKRIPKSTRPGITAPSTAAKKRADDTTSSLKRVPKTTSPKITPPSTAAKNRADDATSALRRVPKSVNPRINASSNAASVAAAARRAISSVQGKTVTVTVKRVNSGNMSRVATGGMITEAGVLHRSPGGPVWGAGSATSDSIPAMLSNGEFVQRAAAVDKYGLAFMAALNNLKIDPKMLPAYKDGGPVDRRQHLAAGGLATGGQPPLTFGGKETYGVTLKTLTDINRKIVALNNPLLSIAANFRRVQAATAAVTVAQRNLTAIQRKSGRTAEQVSKAQERLKTAQEGLRTASENLGQAQAVLADAARTISASLRDAAATTSTDPQDVLAKRKETAVQLTAFNAALLKLRKAGLNDQDLADIAGRGALDGTELANNILAGGKAMVSALNVAQQQLMKAADDVGRTAAVSVIRRAGGGWIDQGPFGVDRVPTLTTRGEFVVEPKAAAANAQFLEAINKAQGRMVVRGPQGHVGGNVTNRTQTFAVPVSIGQMGANSDQVARKIQGRVMDAITMSGLAGGI